MACSQAFLEVRAKVHGGPEGLNTCVCGTLTDSSVVSCQDPRWGYSLSAVASSNPHLRRELRSAMTLLDAQLKP